MVNPIDLSRVDLNLLVLFEAVLKEGHVGRAARTLNLTSPAVSHGLGRLRRLLNDPLFLRTPKGVVPTERALELAATVDHVLSGVRSIIAVAEPFDPATAHRRFTLGAPDGVSSVLIAPLMAHLRAQAPGIDVGVHHLMPVPREMDPSRAWQDALGHLESREIDAAILPLDAVPARFHARELYEETFVIAARKGHPALARPMDLDAYCELRHLVVSLTGDPRGFVDTALAAQGRQRRVTLTVPNFLFALSVLAESDLVAALPGTFVAAHGKRFGVTCVEAPFAMPISRMQVVVSRAALRDAGVAWLADTLRAPAP
jgi:DNA-binding transcriptional LysR family regulator